MFIVLSIPDMPFGHSKGLKGVDTNIMDPDEKYNFFGFYVDKYVMNILAIYPFRNGEKIHIEVKQRNCCLFKEDTISDDETLLGVKYTKELRDILIEYASYPHRSNDLVMDNTSIEITFSS